MLLSSGCLVTSSPPSQSSLTATGIINAELGNYHRCDVIYPEIYAKTLAVLKQMFSRLNPDGTVNTNLVRHSKAQLVLARTRRMMLNIMRSFDRPIHPVAFLAVIKDFESSIQIDNWAVHGLVKDAEGRVLKDEKGRNRYDGMTTENCTSKVCHGYFQVDTISERYAGWDWELCGDNGLGLLGMAGGPDYCAALFWWTQGQNGQKCAKMKENGGFAGRPHENVTDARVCNIVNLNNQPNPCNDPNYTWTVDTFSYGHYCTYIQKNQWEVYGIHDTWRKLYTGFEFRGNAIKGYEYCSVFNYALKHYELDSPQWPAFTPLNVSPELIRRAVRDFGYEMGLLPSWADPEWQPEVNPDMLAQIQEFNRTSRRSNLDRLADEDYNIEAMPKQFHPALQAIRARADAEAQRRYEAQQAELRQREAAEAQQRREEQQQKDQAVLRKQLIEAAPMNPQVPAQHSADPAPAHPMTSGAGATPAAASSAPAERTQDPSSSAQHPMIQPPDVDENQPLTTGPDPAPSVEPMADPPAPAIDPPHMYF